jgi:putative ABC transport system ATP-binding protein
VYQLTGINKHFVRKHGQVAAAQNVDLSIDDGEFVGITGPSGSGKSTLLLMLGGMSTPTSGTVTWDNQNIYALGTGARAHWRGATVGFVFQAFNLVPYLDVFENVSLALSISGDASAAQAQRVNNLLKKVGLWERRDHLPNELSIGQQQRVALARALVKDPKVILADEPTGNLDRETAAEIVDMLAALNREGKTVILVTHDPDIARQTRRNIRIVDGKIVR